MGRKLFTEGVDINFYSTKGDDIDSTPSIGGIPDRDGRKWPRQDNTKKRIKILHSLKASLVILLLQDE